MISNIWKHVEHLSINKVIITIKKTKMWEIAMTTSSKDQYACEIDSLHQISLSKCKPRQQLCHIFPSDWEEN
jgi:hypothetical protein